MQSVREQTKAATHVVGVIEEVYVAGGADPRRPRASSSRATTSCSSRRSAMKEMAKQVHRTADEQSRGTRLIVETIENVRSATDKMATSVNEQTAGCARVVAATWEAFKRAKDTHEATGQLEAGIERVRANAAGGGRAGRRGALLAQLTGPKSRCATFPLRAGRCGRILTSTAPRESERARCTRWRSPRASIACRVRTDRTRARRARRARDRAADGRRTRCAALLLRDLRKGHDARRARARDPRDRGACALRGVRRRRRARLPRRCVRVRLAASSSIVSGRELRIKEVEVA